MITTDFVDAVGKLNNRKGIGLMLLATQVLAIGPMAVLLSAPQLYIDLPTPKLLLMSVGLTLPSLLFGSGLILSTSQSGTKDERAAEGIVMAAVALTFMQCAFLFSQWLASGRGFHWHLTACALGIATIAFAQWSDNRERRRKHVPEAVARSLPHELEAFATARLDEFEAWRAAVVIGKSSSATPAAPKSGVTEDTQETK